MGDEPLLIVGMCDTTPSAQESIILPNNSVLNLVCAGLATKETSGGIETMAVAEKILSLVISDFDFNKNKSHKKALEFVNVLLNAVKAGDTSTLVFWDTTKASFTVINFGKVFNGKESVYLSSIMDPKANKSSASFNTDLLQATNISSKTMALLSMSLWNDITVDENYGFVTLKI